MRARKQGNPDVTSAALNVGEDSGGQADVRFSEPDAAKLSEPGSAWLAALPDDSTKAAYVTACTICHDMGSPLARGPRDAAGWEAVIHQMRSQAETYSVIVKMDDQELARWLGQHQMGSKLASIDLFGRRSGAVRDARITEYEDILSAASAVLKPKGRVALIYPATRLLDLVVRMRALEFEPKRMQVVYPSMQEESKLVLVEGARGGKGGVKILPPLMDQGEFSIVS